ncbi:MAG: type II secretion system major pseudopilin GspG [Usitatibacter sp.]
MRDSRPPSRRQRGFTILEIVIVFVLIGSLLAFVVPRIYSQMGQAKTREAAIRIQSLAGNIELYRLEVGKYPENLQALVKQPAGADKWNGPYAKEADLKDAWNNDYKYVIPGQGKAYDLISLGADGKEGGEGENKDVSN